MKGARNSSGNMSNLEVQNKILHENKRSTTKMFYLIHAPPVTANANTLLRGKIK